MRQMSINKCKRGFVTLLFILPALVPLVVFWIYPIFRTIHISFTDWDYMVPEYNYVGFTNYIKLFANENFRNALRQTLAFGLGTIIPIIALGLGLALLLQKNFRSKSFYQLLIFSPWITPTVAVSIVWIWIFEPNAGFANMILNFFGLPGLSWIHSSDTAMLAIIIVTVWKGLGYTMVFYITALEKVPRELYEAASIDSASGLQKFFHITLPLISPTTFFLTIINTITALQAYDQIQILTQGGPAGSTRTLLYLYYQLGFQQFRMGQAAAVVFVLTVITFTLALLQSFISKRAVHY